MALRERRRSLSNSPEYTNLSSREERNDISHPRRDDRSYREKDRWRNPHRSRSPYRQNSNARTKRRSMSPTSDNENQARRRDSRNYRERSPRESQPGRRHKRRRRSYSRSRSRSRSPPSQFRDPSPKALERSRGPLPSQNQAFNEEQQSSLTKTDGSVAPAVEKQKPNFNVTGKLAAASNTIQTAGQTIILKYHEPAESRKPPSRDAWRLYVFKGDEIVDTVQLWEQSCWLFGREGAVADIALEHPSASGQHAVVQFRYIEKRNEFGDRVGKVKPYVLDLESTQGTWLNDERIDEGRYLELRDGDVLKFGRSRREYVLQLPKTRKE